MPVGWRRPDAAGPLTVPAADKVPVPPLLDVLRGFQCTTYRIPLEKNEETLMGISLRLGVVVGCYPAENP